jgi:UDP-N-acetylmuramoyl-L-alanyl-D-glutamate--2,6-diaminopimelate ligase
LRLNDLMDEEDGTIVVMPPGDPDILGLSSDSRQVSAGYLFAALPGTRIDGKRFIDDAVARGATVILTDDPASFDALSRRRPPVTILGDPNPRRRLARMASRFYKPQPNTVVAVTGTNGKTSVSVFTRQIWQRLGHKAASLGTIGIVGPDFALPAPLTTPEPVTLHSELNTLAQNGIDYVAVEASSHGLEQFRLDGLTLKAAAFTNLTRDHLDYHGDMASYRAAKERLFAELLPRDGTAIVNLDDESGPDIAERCRARGQRLIGYGVSARADLRLLAARPSSTGQSLRLSVFGAERDVVLPLIGDFQAMNALAALGLALATQAAPEAAIEALNFLTGAPGRMERVGAHPSGAPILVDYAHTPDALENALRALRAHCRGRIVLVFGCGGDRDAGKRPQMGAIAARLADTVVVTDDNPRGEQPGSIRRAILAACPRGVEIGDRAAAIRHALSLLGKDDVLLLAGKGHESEQIVGTTILPFSDRDTARAALAHLGTAA